MTSQADHMQQLWRRYEAERDHLPASAREVVEWAVAEGTLELPEIDPLDVLAGQMASALREEYATAPNGERYRVNHAVRVTKNGVQTTFWGIMGFAPRRHMETAFTQRREQIVSDCVQLQKDVDVYNTMNPSSPPVQPALDFAEDVAERRAA
jgi:hypothetical protein